MVINNTSSDISELNFRDELVYLVSRSSGPGGQHVNKVSTKVELRFNIAESRVLSSDQKQILLQKLKNKITIDGNLIIVSQESRSQLKNKENALAKFYMLIQKALKPTRKRIPTKPSSTSKKKRLESKKKHSEKKMKRKSPGDETY